MCGLEGFFGAASESADTAPVQAALQQTRRRGPDGDTTRSERPYVLGHERLAIINLDGRAAQPMPSACGRYVIAFNGEIFNFRQLRSTLPRDGATLRTESDKEVLLELFARHGEHALQQLRGMFAPEIWDRQAARDFVARTGFGIPAASWLQAAQQAGGSPSRCWARHVTRACAEART